MAWFGMDCNIFTNPKVMKFSAEARLTVDAAVGKLGRLYGWATQCESETGDISHLPPEEIAAIMRWEKKPEALINAMVSCGLLDRLDGGFSIHDWDELNGNFLKKRRQDRERKK